MEQQHDFTKGPILPLLLRFALPVLLALLLQAMYGAVDLQVVGRFGTAADISAVSTGGQIMQSITIVITGLAMGVTVLLGQRIGECNLREAGCAVGCGICLFAIVAAVVTVVMLLAAPQTAAIMHAPVDAFSGTVAYTRICSAGAVFIVAYNILGSIFRGIGDSVMPLITVLIACICNIAGDLLLVGGFHMGVAGAAYATVAAQAISVALSLMLIRRRKLPFTLERGDVRPDAALIRQILMLVPSAYMQSMSAFVAQNIGAGQARRAARALWCGVATSLAAGFIMGWFTFFHGDILVGLFVDDAAVIAAAWEYLKAYAIDCLFTSFLFCFVGYFNGCGQTLFVMVQGLLGAVGIRLPLAFLISRLLPGSIFALGLSSPCSTLIQILLCGFWYVRCRKQWKDA